MEDEQLTIETSDETPHSTEPESASDQDAEVSASAEAGEANGAEGVSQEGGEAQIDPVAVADGEAPAAEPEPPVTEAITDEELRRPRPKEEGSIAMRTLFVPITDWRRGELEVKLMETFGKLVETEQEKREWDAELGSKIKSLKAECDKIHKATKEGETQSVRCQWFLDYTNGITELCRLDTMAVIETKPLTTDERQLRIEMEDKHPDDQEGATEEVVVFNLATCNVCGWSWSIEPIAELPEGTTCPVETCNSKAVRLAMQVTVEPTDREISDVVDQNKPTRYEALLCNECQHITQIVPTDTLLENSTCASCGSTQVELAHPIDPEFEEHTAETLYYSQLLCGRCGVVQETLPTASASFEKCESCGREEMTLHGEGKTDEQLEAERPTEVKPVRRGRPRRKGINGAVDAGALPSAPENVTEQMGAIADQAQADNEPPF